MSLHALGDLLRRVKLLEQRSTLRQGVVTATSPLSITLAGGNVSITGCKRLVSYTPTIGDTVRVEITGGPPLILGRIV